MSRRSTKQRRAAQRRRSFYQAVEEGKRYGRLLRSIFHGFKKMSEILGVRSPV